MITHLQSVAMLCPEGGKISLIKSQIQLQERFAITDCFDDPRAAIRKLASLEIPPRWLFIDLGLQHFDPFLFVSITKLLVPSINIIGIDFTDNLTVNDIHKLAYVGGAGYVNFATFDATPTVLCLLGELSIENSKSIFKCFNKINNTNNICDSPTLRNYHIVETANIERWGVVTKREKLYMCLKIAGFQRQEKASILCTSVASIKQIANKLKYQFKLLSTNDLSLLAIRNGYVQLYTAI